MQRTEAQRPESQAPQALFDRALEREWLIIAHQATGEQKRDWFVLSRRAAYSITASDGGSSHWTSSTAARRG